MPFEVAEVPRADAAIERLFRASFGGPPPDYPRHFAARRADGGAAAGYVHLTVAEPGVFLIGGLCVDARAYRALTREQRAEVAGQGSLSRLLLARAIAQLGPKRAVFAYTGDVRSRRDCEALGFVPARPPYLIVQWHDEPAASREALVARVAALGPF